MSDPVRLDPLRLMEDEGVRRDVRRDLERFARARPAFDEEAALVRLSAALAVLPTAGAIGAAAATSGWKTGMIAKAAAWKIVLLCALGGGGIAMTVAVSNARLSSSPSRPVSTLRAVPEPSAPGAGHGDHTPDPALIGASVGQVSLSLAPGLAAPEQGAAPDQRAPLAVSADLEVLAPRAGAPLPVPKPSGGAPAPTRIDTPACLPARGESESAATTLQELHEKAAQAVRERESALDEGVLPVTPAR